MLDMKKYIKDIFFLIVYTYNEIQGGTSINES